MGSCQGVDTCRRHVCGTSIAKQRCCECQGRLFQAFKAARINGKHIVYYVDASRQESELSAGARFGVCVCDILRCLMVVLVSKYQSVVAAAAAETEWIALGWDAREARFMQNAAAGVADSEDKQLAAAASARLAMTAKTRMMKYRGRGSSHF